MDFEVSKETVKVMADYSWMLGIYGVIFLLPYLLSSHTEEDITSVNEMTGKRYVLYREIFSDMIVAIILGTGINLAILALSNAPNVISNKVSEASGCQVVLNQSNEQEIRKGIMKDPSYLDTNAELLVEKVTHDSDKEIITSVYAKDRHDKGYPHGLYIVRRVTKAPSAKDQENYQIYKSDSPELQNLLEKMNFDLSNN